MNGTEELLSHSIIDTTQVICDLTNACVLAAHTHLIGQCTAHMGITERSSHFRVRTLQIHYTIYKLHAHVRVKITYMESQQGKNRIMTESQEIVFLMAKIVLPYFG